MIMGVVNTARHFSNTGTIIIESLHSESRWVIVYVCFVLLRELELQRKSSATDIAKKKHEAESAVSTHTHMQTHSYSFCVPGSLIIVSRFSSPRLV